MWTKHCFQTIDTHTGGQPTRIITSGIPPIRGKTMREKMLYLRDNMDDVRQLLMFEPRGNDIMSGVILTAPCEKDCDFGAIFIEVGGYLPMCGHDTIGLCTALIEMGMAPSPSAGVAELKLDTPAGVVKVRISVEEMKAKEVSFENVPAFVLEKDIYIDVPDYGKIKMDICYGGNFYAIIRGMDMGLRISATMAAQVVHLGRLVRNAVNSQLDVCHPEFDFIRGLTHVQFYEPVEDSVLHYKNTVVIPNGTLDRSPCGTGTSARMASLYADKELSVGDTFIHESIIGSKFKGRIVRQSILDNFTAIVPEITGDAHVTGLHTFFTDPDDQFKRGFQLQCF